MRLLTADFALRAYLAAGVVGLAGPVLGSFLVQRRLALIGDGMGHLAFAGVALGVALGVAPVWGALVLTIVGAFALERLRRSGRLTGDVSLALLFYFGIALGAVVLSAVGRFDANALGFLFGSLFATTWPQVVSIVLLCTAVLAVTFLLYKELVAVALDEQTARASGLPVEGLNLVMLILIALLVSAGTRVVGLLLIAALLVVPVAAGSRLAHSFRGAMQWGMVAGVLSALAGVVIALVQGEIAPGGTIVLTALAVFVIAALAGTRIARHHVRGEA